MDESLKETWMAAKVFTALFFWLGAPVLIFLYLLLR